MVDFKMNDEYRKSDEYAELMKHIKSDAPWMPQYVAEMCIIMHKTNPQAYKQDKRAKDVFKQPLKPPKNAGEVLVDGKIGITDLTEDIIKQREEFEEKYMKVPELTTIEEVLEETDK